MSKRKMVLFLVLAATSTFATVALGQDGGAEGPASWLKSVAAFLYNPITLAAVGIAIQFLPGVRRLVSNHVAPLLTTLIAWVGGLLNPGGAALGAWLVPNDPTGSTHTLLAAIGGMTPTADAAGVHGANLGVVGVFALFGLGLRGLFGGIGGASLQAMQGYVMHRMYACPGKLLPGLPQDSI